MNYNELITLKMNLLGGMDSYIRTMYNSDIIQFWNRDGVPKNATEEDLKSIAETEEAWVSTCAWFETILSNCDTLPNIIEF